MSVQKFLGTIETDGVKDERGIETPSLSATGEVSGKTGVFSESVTAPSFSGNLTGNVTGDVTGDITGMAAKATADAEGNVIPTTYATIEALAEETSARQAADETLSKGITAEATERSAAIEDIVDGTTVVGKATADAEGNVIPTTYATLVALSSGLAGKANTSGTYPNLTVGNATNATNATQVNGGFISTTLTANDLSLEVAIPSSLRSSNGVWEVYGNNGGGSATDFFAFHGIVCAGGSVLTDFSNGYVTTFACDGETITIERKEVSGDRIQSIMLANTSAYIRRICL